MAVDPLGNSMGVVGTGSKPKKVKKTGTVVDPGSVAGSPPASGSSTPPTTPPTDAQPIPMPSGVSRNDPLGNSMGVKSSRPQRKGPFAGFSGYGQQATPQNRNFFNGRAQAGASIPPAQQSSNRRGKK